MMTDAEMKEAVLSELAWDTHVEATEVGIDTIDDHLRVDPWG